MFEYDIPEDANPAQVYGTIEFERARLSRVPVPVRRAVADNFEVMTPAEAKRRFMAVYRRNHPPTPPVVMPRKKVAAVAPVTPAPSPVVEKPFVPPTFWTSPPVDEAESVEPRQRDWMIIETRPKVEQIIRATAAYFEVSREDILSQRRQASIVLPRQLAMYLAKTLTLRSLPEIGRRFGGRDHTTVLHGVRKIDSMLAAGHESLIVDIAAITKQLGVRGEVAA